MRRSARTAGPMRCNGWRKTWCSICCGVLSLPLGAAEPQRDLFELSLEELLEVRVVTASWAEQSLKLAPAMVSVITREQLARHHYRSVADALEQVPGLYGIDDGVSTAFGVRGIASSSRAYNRAFKVLIDGQPQQFRFDGTHYLGAEFLPLSLIERIEIVRGPASALYGADAFLGVINIITRLPSHSGGELQLRAEQEHESGALAAAQFDMVGDGWRALFAVQGGELDYSGRELPASSPLYHQHDHAADARSRPASALLRWQGETATHRSDVYWHRLRLDSVAEFLDFGILSHHNRMALEQDSIWWRGEWMLRDDWTVHTRLALSHGAPGDDERLSLDTEPLYPRRKFAFDSRELAVHSQWRWNRDRQLAAGIDMSDDDEQLMRVYSVNTETGVITAQGPDQGAQMFRNRGVYLQWQEQISAHLGITANWRRDRHNLYGNDDNWRLALIWQLHEQLTVKLLGGSSFKAPAAAQLYAQPLFAGDVVGNPDLRPERARMQELAIDWRPAPQWWLNASVYRLRVKDRVEVLFDGGERVPDNVSRMQGWGAESELRWQGETHGMNLQIAWQDSEEELDDVFRGTLRAPTERHPKLWLRLGWQWQLPLGELSASWRHVSERRASKENITENRLDAYQLPAYDLLRIAWQLPLGDQGWRISIDNLSGEQYAEPGFGGIDLPAAERRVALSWWWQWERKP